MEFDALDVMELEMDSELVDEATSAESEPVRERLRVADPSAVGDAE